MIKKPLVIQQQKNTLPGKYIPILRMINKPLAIQEQKINS